MHAHLFFTACVTFLGCHSCALQVQLNLFRALMQGGIAQDRSKTHDCLCYDCAQVLLQILSHVGSPDDLHHFFCTSQGSLGLAADPVLKACWLTKHRQSRAVDLAARKGGADVVIHLLRMGGVSATEKALYAAFDVVSTLTPIEIAVEESLPEVATYLLSRSDVRADVAGATSALHSAAQYNHVECLQAFLAPDSPVNANSLNQYGHYPLHSAAGNARLEAVQLLLSRGAVCTVRDRDGSTPLHYVCCDSDKKAERAQILGMLLESGGDGVKNAQNNDGYTPLHLAVCREVPECCERLLRAGSQDSLSIRDEFGETPLEMAVCEQHSCRGVLLRYAGGNG